MSLNLSRHDRIVILAKEVGFDFDFQTCEIIRPSGHRRKIDKVYGQQRYPVDSFNYEGKSYSFKIHRFCAYLKFGDELFAENIVVRHLDDNPLNLSWDNLELGTPKDNSQDIEKSSRSLRAKYARSFQERPSQCQTSDTTVREILVDFFTETQGLGRTPWGLNTKLASKYGKSKSAIESIVYGKSFKDVYEVVYKEFQNV